MRQMNVPIFFWYKYRGTILVAAYQLSGMESAVPSEVANSWGKGETFGSRYINVMQKDTKNQRTKNVQKLNSKRQADVGFGSSQT